MKKVFIVGCPRSGTTLVQEILAGHADVFACRETHFFHRARRDGRRKLFDHVALSRAKVLDAYEFLRSNVELVKPYDPGTVNSLAGAALFFDNLMTCEAQAKGKSAWVEKSPENLMYIPWIKRYIPSAQFIHVLRDGRDVAASLVDAARRFPDRWRRYGDVKLTIRAYNDALTESMKYYGRADHIFVLYEHMLEDVEENCRKLYAILGLESEGLRSSLEGLHQQLVRKDEGWKNDYHGEIVNTRLLKYNQVFNDEEKLLLSKRVKSWSPQGCSCI